jgi:glycosidase
MRNAYLLLLILFLGQQLLAQKATKGEVMYHVCQRSFYDSNGDSNGDLNGLRQKLPYLQDLGVTSILLFPLYEADCYHNYFANDFEKIDPEFGTMQDYIELIKEVHRRGMKIYLDMETQYVTSEHLWWKDAVGNLDSKYSDYILFEDSAHQTPATMVFDLRLLNGFDGKVIYATTVNLKSQKVLDYNIALFSYFLDPNQDGYFDDGVDGFRLDHAMDHLDGKPTLTNLFAEFWKPLIAALKEVNPEIKIVAEQANWEDYGFEYFEKATVDRMFGFGLQKSILAFDKQLITENAQKILCETPKGKEQLIFIENHDIDRFASLDFPLEKQKTAAALMLLMGGVPSIYYGQELGMQGKVYAFGNTDGNDIGRREAFEWYQTGQGDGMSYWYKNSGAWWTNANSKPNDGISLEEQRNNPNSLFNWYKAMIALKQSNAALAIGSYENVPNNNDQVLSFYRQSKQQKALVLVNLSAEKQVVSVNDPIRRAKSLSNGCVPFQTEITLAPYEWMVWEVKKPRASLGFMNPF